MALAPLDRGEMQQMVSEVAARHALNHQAIDALFTRTGGVPLFIEEVTRLLVERDGQVAMQAIPLTLQAMLTARLDRLGSAKEVGQIASMLGREFTYPLIRAVAGQSDAAVIAALTAQNTRGVTAIHDVPPDFIAAQIDAVFSDLAVGAVKIGMVAQHASIDAIAAGLKRWSPKRLVLDPVMVATSGDRLLAAEAVDALRGKLIPGASVITPNLPEAAALLDEPVAETEAAVENQGQRLLGMGCRAVLIKGGHAQGAESPLVDLHRVLTPEIDHGTGRRVDEKDSRRSGNRRYLRRRINFASVSSRSLAT